MNSDNYSLTEPGLLEELTKRYLPEYWDKTDNRKALFSKRLERGFQIIAFNKTTLCYEMVRFILSAEYDLLAIECGASVLPALEYPVGIGWFSDASDIFPQAPNLGLEFGEIHFRHWSCAWMSLGSDPQTVCENPGSEEERIGYLIYIFESLREILPAFIERKTVERTKDQGPGAVWTGLEPFLSSVKSLRDRFGDSLPELRNSSPERIKALLLNAGLDPALFDEYERFIYNGCGLKYVKEMNEPLAKWVKDPEFASGWLENEVK